VAERASTATVVFTDMVGSTALRARLGEERADALQRVHDGILRARVEANDGEVLKTVGDGMVAVFPAASEALTATVQIQQAIARHNRRPDALAELSIRVGLSTGDVSWEGGDCFGTPMVEAARLEAAAAGGQILCSDFVRMMSRGRGGHEFSTLGFLELKGLPEPLAACEVVWVPAPEVAFPLPPELATRGARPFVSRIAELELAERVLTDASRERGAVLWILGEPGIGKTRLATEIALRAQARDNVVLFGRCNQDLSVPYQPFLEALRFFIAQVPDEELAERLGDSPRELVRLVPELAARLRLREPPAPTSSPEVEQYHLFEAVRSWLATAGRRTPVVVVLDDVQWAAAPTLQLLGHTARSAEPSRVLLVCTARNTSPDDNEALAALVEDLGRKGVPSHRLELGGLGVEEVGELVSSAAGRRLDDRLRTLAIELTQETAGNPLFVDALLGSLPGDPAWHPGKLPRSVAETVRRRVARLSPELQDLLRTASVVGLDFGLRVAALAADRTELDSLAALEAAEHAGLVQEVGPDRYRFTHALVRSALRDELSQSRRVRTHLAVGEALEKLHPNDMEEQAAPLAYHFFEGVPAGGAEKAYRYSLLAAERSTRLLSFAEAAEAYGRALALFEHVTDADPLTRGRLFLAQGKVLRWGSDFHWARQTFRAAIDEARAVRSPVLLAEAAVAFEDASFEPGLPGADAVELLEEAERALGSEDSKLRVLAIASLSRAYEFSGRRAEGTARGDEALALARRIGDTALIAAVLVRTGFYRVGLKDTSAMAERGLELTNLAGQLGDNELYRMGLASSIQAAAQLGDLDAMDPLLAEYENLAKQLGQPMFEWEILRYKWLRAFLAGDLALAESLLAGSEVADRAHDWQMEGVDAVKMFLLRREQGRLGGLAPAIRTIVQLEPAASLWGPGLAALYAELGMVEDARAELERLAADGFAAVADDGTREMSLSLLAEVAVAVEDPGCAARLLEELRPVEGYMLVFWGNLACLGPADRLLGMLASTAGRVEEAEGWFERALTFSRRLESPLWTAHCLFDYAEHRRRIGQSGFEPMMVEAAELCRHHGLAGLGEKVARVAGYPYPAAEPD
jgi:class 3 adenylate cyclase/tetratricopeptide (TPR) repeat protein